MQQQTGFVHVSNSDIVSTAFTRGLGVTERQSRLTPRRKDRLLLSNLRARKRRAHHEISGTLNLWPVSVWDARSYFDSSFNNWILLMSRHLVTDRIRRETLCWGTDRCRGRPPSWIWVLHHQRRTETLIPEFSQTTHRCSIFPSLAGIPSFREVNHVRNYMPSKKEKQWKGKRFNLEM